MLATYTAQATAPEEHAQLAYKAGGLHKLVESAFPKARRVKGLSSSYVRIWPLFCLYGGKGLRLFRP